MLERIRWWLASVFASWALELMRPKTAEDGFSMALTNAEKQAQWRERREQRSKALEQKVAEQQAELERLRNQSMQQLRNQSEAQIDPQTLSMSAREELQAAIQQEKRKLQAEFERAVQAEIARVIGETAFPPSKQELAEPHLHGVCWIELDASEIRLLRELEKRLLRPPLPASAV